LDKFIFFEIMKILYSKYHALGNDFIIIDKSQLKNNTKKLPEITQSLCNRRTGVGADGVIFISKSKSADALLDLYNVDGTWAEKSGNGLRIVGYHSYLNDKRKKKFTFEMAGEFNAVEILSETDSVCDVQTELGTPSFDTKKVPVKTKQEFMIQSELLVGGVKFPVTCLNIGNPHTVLFVVNFDFDWESLGSEIEIHKLFPDRTNVEFVKIVTRKKLIVADWERGAGATGSSGTGAAAAVCAGVMSGQADRNCEVKFDSGSLFIDWDDETNIVKLTGPVVKICDGNYFV